MKPVLAKWLLAIASLGIALIAAELILRFAFPRYQYAANASYRRSEVRIWSRIPGSCDRRAHPDTGEAHLIAHNNLGLRQNRNIEPAKPTGELRIGLFGDSWTENLRIAAPSSLSEVLDYLLNRHVGTATVLNFGVEGYGTDQLYLFYEDSEAAKQLDLVIYIFCGNDIRNLHENGMFDLDEAGRLVSTPRPETPPWTRALSRLHLTYLLIDARNRLLVALGERSSVQSLPPLAVRNVNTQMQELSDARFRDEVAQAVETQLLQGLDSADLRRYVSIFRLLLAQWRDQVQQRGGRFLVAVVPSTPQGFVDRLLGGYEVINLRERFEARGIAAGQAGGFEGPTRWRFRNDGHWNEFGNQLGALELFYAIDGRGAPARASVEQDLCAYYRSFSGGWVPEACAGVGEPDEDTMAEVRRRYDPLEEACRD